MGCYLNDEDKLITKDLESKHAKLLLDKEREWRLKSRATWIDWGIKIPIFFQNFANHRKSVNTIWELSNKEGRKVNNF
jgi:hypothetical protein